MSLVANFELKYDTEQHNNIRDAIRNRLRKADFAISKKKEAYAKNEETYSAYIPTTEVDTMREGKRDAGEPQYTTLDIPFSYAVLLSWHTYISSTFLARAPVVQVSGRHGETEQQIQAVEAIMDYQTQVGEHLVPYYLWILDAGKYGAGIIGNYWDEEIRQVSEIVEEPVTYLGIKLSDKTKKVKRTKRVKGYQGNRIFNVRPQDFLFDSRVSMLHFQEGEFCGRYADLSWNTVIKRAEYGQYYNIKALRKRKANLQRRNNSDATRDLGSSQITLPDAVTNENEVIWDDLAAPDFARLLEMHIELIPKDWKLGTSEYPEKWVFTLADDEVIIESQPYDSLHGKFPYGVLEYEMEGYGLQKRSMLDMLGPLSDTMTWLVNTHFYNVRSVLNGQFIADPSRLRVSDFKSDGGGRIVRLKPAAYGQDIRTMFHQISVSDVTQNHLRDMSAISDLIQRISGVTDNIMGVVNSGGRKSATEIRSSNAGGTNRLKTQAEYFSAMGFGPVIQQLLQNTQQKYDGEMLFKLAGDLMEEGNQFTQVDAETIAGFYDFVPVDGTLPVDRFAQVTMWTQLLGQMRSMPEVMQDYDMGGIFAWVAQLGGLKNIKRFRVNVRPDAAIANDLKAGNVVGLGDAKGSGSAGTPENSTGVPGAVQVPGLGPTG
jgi:hypothetical protein